MSDKIRKLSDAIKFGSTFIGETKIFFGDDYKCGCAIGTAYLAVINSNPSDAISPDSIFDPLAERFGVPKEVIADVSVSHFRGEMNRAECASWLESKGY
jgi:hypothetical protein